MKVKDLLKELQELPPEMLEAELICSSDAEGNKYSPLSGIDPDQIYIPECTWSGDVYCTNSTADDRDMEEEDWQEFLKNPRCVVLYPVN